METSIMGTMDFIAFSLLKGSKEKLDAFVKKMDENVNQAGIDKLNGNEPYKGYFVDTLRSSLFMKAKLGIIHPTTSRAKCAAEYVDV